MWSRVTQSLGQWLSGEQTSEAAADLASRHHHTDSTSETERRCSESSVDSFHRAESELEAEYTGKKITSSKTESETQDSGPSHVIMGSRSSPESYEIPPLKKQKLLTKSEIVVSRSSPESDEIPPLSLKKQKLLTKSEIVVSPPTAGPLTTSQQLTEERETAEIRRSCTETQRPTPTQPTPVPGTSVVTEVPASGRSTETQPTSTQPTPAPETPHSSAPSVGVQAYTPTQPVSTTQCTGQENAHPQATVSQTQDTPDTWQVYVNFKGLPLHPTEEELRNTFNQFGNILEVSVRRANNFGFVVFDSPESVERVLDWSEPLVIRGNTLKVERKRSRERRGSSPLQETAEGPPHEVNLRTLIEYLKPVPAEKTYELGLHLGVPVERIKTFEHNWPRNSDRVRSEILQHWLDNAEERTWRVIDGAVKRLEYDSKATSEGTGYDH